MNSLRNLLPGLVLSLFMGCGESHSDPYQLGGGNSPPAVHQIYGSIFVGTVEVLPPPFVPAADYAALQASLEEYEQDAEALLGWAPPAGILVIFDDPVTGMYLGPRPPRTKTLTWNRGTHGRPLRFKFAPMWGLMIVQDRRQLLGTTSIPLTAQEWDTIDSGRNLPVLLTVSDPSKWDYR